ncbi:galactosylceramide sulfotransferase-like isoform X2 [Portunus trituberculatus]|nr:galactosylceramide sulfotransferase-like isoform X2 [Portunus trituberculatus]
MMLSSTLNKLQPNIFAIHTKWNHIEVKKVMPTNTVFFTIVREPIALFEAFYAFSRAKKRTGLTLEQYIREVPTNQKRENKAGLFHYNTMAWDFGMPEEKLNNLSDVWNMVMQADEQFGLVMVVERMEESLVLLADYLCWELSDMLVLDLNSLRNKFKKPLRQELRNILQKKLAPDYLIYRYFLKKFDQQVEAYGRDRMAVAVSRLRDMMAVLMDLCSFIKKNAPQLAGKYRPSSNKVEGFKANGDMCSLYTLPELSFLSLLRQKQRKEITIHKTNTSQPPG